MGRRPYIDVDEEEQQEVEESAPPKEAGLHDGKGSIREFGDCETPDASDKGVPRNAVSVS
jgi:hypothetical protein